MLQDTFERMVGDAEIQLVTITGEPGVGKTRLLAEFRTWVDDRAELVYWRQGRCLPYGDGITFWALGEIVKAHAGILESDAPAEAAAKLGVAVAGADDAEWLRRPPRAARGARRGRPDRSRGVVCAPGSGSSSRSPPIGNPRPALRGSALGGRRAARVRRAARRLVDRDCRFSSSARVGRSSTTTLMPHGAAASATRRRSHSRPLSTGRDCTSRRRAPRGCRPTGRDAGGAPRPGRRQPAVRGGVRPALPRARLRRRPAVARLGPGAHRRTARHAPAGPQGVAPGRRRHRQGLLGRSTRVDGRTQS